MASENGRTFTADLERATAEQRRNYGHAQESLVRAEQKIAATQESLEKFAPAVAEATVNGSRPPQAAVELERQKAEAEKMAAAFRALIPERKRLLQQAEGKWVAEHLAPMRERFTQLLEAELAAARSWVEGHAATEALRQDVTTAAQEFSLSLPGGPNVTPIFQLLESAVSAWTGSSTTSHQSNGLVAVRRLPPDQYRPLKTGHRLEKAVNAIAGRVQLDRYSLSETFGVLPEEAKILEQVHLVELVPAGGPS